MRSIGCRMGGGNQEDAHEFLRLLVMSMQLICLEGVGGEKEIDPRLQETTLIQQIFGGRLKSKVQAVSPSQVMSEGAYMLFYSRSSPRPPQVYIEQKLLLPSIYAKRNIAKSPKTSKHEQQRPSTSLYAPASSAHPRNDLGKDNGDDAVDQAAEYIPKAATNRIAVLDGTCRLSLDFSDVTSSDWSLFTSSDDSSFTTESTRDSFSTVDHGDNTTTLDAISSIFSPFYVPDYANASSIACARSSLGVTRARFFTENSSCAVDSSVQTRPPSRVHKGKNDAEHSAQTRPSASVGHCKRHQGQ